MGELRRLFRVLRDNPGRIKEGPDWLRRKLYIWRSSRRGPSGFVANQAKWKNYDESRPRYDHLRVVSLGDDIDFPEVRLEQLPSPDEGIDILFGGPGDSGDAMRRRLATAGGFHCVPSPDGWDCSSADGSTVRSVRSRAWADFREFNPIGRSVDTALIEDGEPFRTLTAEELRMLAAIRIPVALDRGRQVAEAVRALACGTPVVVDPESPVVSEIGGAGVIVVPDPAPLTVGRLGFDQPYAFERASAAAQRTGFWSHSSAAVADELVTQLGFRRAVDPSVSIVLVTRRPELVFDALAFAARQTYGHLEVVVGLHGAAEDPGFTGRARSTRAPVTEVAYFDGRVPFGEVLDDIVDRTSGRLIAKFDDDDWYSRHHVADLVAAWIMTRADVVGKTANFAYLEASDRTLGYDDELQHKRVEHIPGGTMLAPRDLLQDYRFGRSTRAIDSVLLRKVRADGGFLYSTTRQGFMRRRHSGHTAGFDDEWFVRRAHGRTLPGLRLDIAGVRPVDEAEPPGEVHDG